jgi:fluoride ion exporter CrcB/FEX
MSPNTSLSPGHFAMTVAAVATGGGLGTLLRDLLLRTSWLSAASTSQTSALYGSHAGSWTSQVPWMLLVINFLGVLAATVLLRGPLRHHDPNDLARLVVITGFFGGFTSYSGLFVDIAALWHVYALAGFALSVGAVASGVLAGWIGLRVRRL